MMYGSEINCKRVSIIFSVPGVRLYSFLALAGPDCVVVLSVVSHGSRLERGAYKTWTARALSPVEAMVVIFSYKASTGLEVLSRGLTLSRGRRSIWDSCQTGKWC